jgi:hypothetical protein
VELLYHFQIEVVEHLITPVFLNFVPVDFQVGQAGVVGGLEDGLIAFVFNLIYP